MNFPENWNGYIALVKFIITVIAGVFRQWKQCGGCDSDKLHNIY